MADVPTPELSTYLEPFANLVEEIKQPIAGGNPYGDDVMYDDTFLELKGEIDRIGSAATDIDYDRIVELGYKILRTRSKELTTAGYLVVGLSRTQGLAGIAEAFVVIHTLIDTFWEGLHPKKPVRRRNALQFAADRVKEWLDQTFEQAKPAEADRTPLEATQAVVAALQEFTMKEMAENAPALSGVAASLRDVIRRLPKPVEPEPEPQPVAAMPTGDGSSAAGRVDAAPTPVASASSDVRSPSEANQLVLKAVTFLREQDRTSPIPYRLLRTVRWGILQQEPPHANGTTKVAPPLAQRMTFLTGLLEKGEFARLVEEGEASFQQSPFHFWLDLQRLLVAAMEALGVPYQGVAEAVLQETALLVKRLPGLPRLTFSDGTPFADPLTQEWLETQVAPMLGSGGGAAASARATGSDHVEKQYQEARQKLGQGDLSGALASMQEGHGNDSSQEDRFRRRLYQALLCVRGNQPAVARALLESLEDEVNRHALDLWNPTLTLEVWSNLYTCYQTLAKSVKGPEQAVLRERAAGVLDKMVRLDAGYALRIMT